MSTSPDSSTEQRVQEAILRALKMPACTPSTPLRMGSTPGWDSMGHMMVVMELEKEFGTRFPPYLLPQLLDVPSIAKAVSKPA